MDIIPVVYHMDTDGWWADSPTIPDWTATAPSLDELRVLAEEGVRFALERDDIIVEHHLEYGLSAHADVTFDFVTGQTIVNERPRDGRQTAGAHLQLQTA